MNLLFDFRLKWIFVGKKFTWEVDSVGSCSKSKTLTNYLPKGPPAHLALVHGSAHQDGDILGLPGGEAGNDKVREPIDAFHDVL